MNVVDSDKIRKPLNIAQQAFTPWVGAWVRFPLSGKLVVGEVRYVTAPSPGTLMLHTDQGEIDSTNILEVRW